VTVKKDGYPQGDSGTFAAVALFKRMRDVIIVNSMPPEIIREPVTREKLVEHARAIYGDMAKVVVDVHRRVMAIGGEMHADGEALLLADGSKQEDLWGANVYLEPLPNGERIAYTSLINIRPRQGNRAMEIQDFTIRARVKEVIDALVP